MNVLGFEPKQVVYKALGRLVYSLGLLRMLNAWVENFHGKTDEQGQWTFPTVQRRTTRTVQILTFHGISDGPIEYLPTLPVSIFRAQMEYLANYFCVLDLHEAVTRMAKHDVPNNAVVLTFDDGYRDNFLNAFPVLQEFGLSATFFLPTDVIGTGKLLWHDQVCWAIAHTQKNELEGFGSREKYRFHTQWERESTRDGVLLYMRSLPDDKRQQKIERLYETLEMPMKHEADALMLNWEEVKLMRQSGMRFGAHTVTHPILSRLPLEQAKDEVRDSRKIIHAHLGDSEIAFAYPSGRKEDYNQEIKEIVMEEGFYCAVSTVWGGNEEQEDPFELKRMGIDGRDIDTFRLRFLYYRFCT